MPGSANIKVEGLGKLRKALKATETGLQNDLKQVHKDAAESVAARARDLAPVRTGKLRDSIRAFGSQSFGTVKAGKASVKYYGWIDFGGTIRFKTSARKLTRPYKPKGRIIYVALAEKRTTITAKYAEEVENIIRKSGL